MKQILFISIAFVLSSCGHKPVPPFVITGKSNCFSYCDYNYNCSRENCCSCHYVEERAGKYELGDTILKPTLAP